METRCVGVGTAGSPKEFRGDAVRESEHNRPIRVYCMDPHELMLAGLGTRFAREPDIILIGATSDPAQCTPSVARERPDVLITEIEIAGVDVFGLIACVARHHPDTRTLVYTAHSKPACAEAAFAAGAFGFFSKAESPDELIEAVRSVPYSHERLLGSAVRAAMETGTEESNGVNAALAQLTRREIEVLCLIGRGMSRVEIAKSIRRSPKTVDAHRSSIMSKLGFKDRVQLARFAIREGLVRV